MNSDKNSVFYRAILQNLFFATLNTEMDKRGWTKEEQNFMAHSLYRHKECFQKPGEALGLFKNIPFLNGGLFECLDKDLGEKARPRYVRVDGFSRRPDSQPVVPDFLFFGAERDVDLSADYGAPKYKRVTVRGLIHTLNHYNFTIEENTPLDQEVALDPELSGKVFENLLAAYNPETGATARKQTGSFYTPREIVSYMVDEALIAYLKTKLEQGGTQGGTDIPVCDSKGDKGGTGIPACVSSSESDTGIPACVSEPTDKNVCATMKSATLEDRLRHLFAYNDEPHQFTAAEVDALIAAIDNLKALDPAVGSGAFPMGILHRLVFILGKLDSRNEKWKERQVRRVRDAIATAEKIEEAALRERTVRELEQQIAGVNEAFERNELDYGRKLYLIENCIYGVDIQPIAVQIAKMRFFISLIVDQKVEGDTGIPACAPSTERDTGIPACAPSTERDTGIPACDSKTAQTEVSVPPLPPWNRAVRPLPNLETKFVAANTLIGVDRPDAQVKLFSNAKVDKLKLDLTGIRHRMFTARTPSTKQHLRERDETIRLALAEEIRESVVKANDDEIHRIQIEIEKTRKDLEEEQSKPVEWEITRFTNLFGETEETRFDKTKEKKRHLREQIKALESNLDRATHRDTEIDATAKQLADWDPYDQNASADFFDPEWMFGLQEGFDVVIGNPPYLRVQGLQQTQPHLVPIYRERFKAAQGSFDLYALFIEQGYNLLNQRGNFAFIVPHKFLQATFGKGLRALLMKHQALRQIVRFGAEQVFDESTTYTCLLFLSHEAQAQFRLHEVKSLDASTRVLDTILRGQPDKDYQSADLLAPKTDDWDFHAGSGKLLEKLRQYNITLEGITRKIFVGLQTSADKIYVLKVLKWQNQIVVCYSRKLDREIEIERGLVKPFLLGKNVHRYQPPSIENVVIFPYLIEADRAELMSQKFIRDNYPRGWEYLKENKRELSEREEGKMRGENFYAYIYPKNLTEFEAIKIMTPDICHGPQMTLDSQGDVYHTTTLYSSALRDSVKDDPRFLLGVLNSRVLWYFMTVTGTVLRGGYLRFKTEYLRPFPIPCSFSKQPPTVQQQKNIAELVDRILAAKKDDPEADTLALEREIDQRVYALYGLTADEIKIVEEASK